MLYRCNLKKFQYDPEDIFSFQPDKVRRALSSLIQQKSKFLQLLYPKQQDSVSSTVLETKLDIIVHILCKEAALLTRLRMIQQLDILDYQGAKLALEALGVSTQHDLEKLEKKIFGKSFSPTWLKEELLHLNNHDDMIFHSEEEKLRMEWCLAEDTRELEESFQRGRSYLRSLDSVELARILGDFLYSTITKDCSLLITFVPVSDYSGLPCIWKTLCIGQQMYYYCISVVDLEPKSLKKLNKWLESDRYLFQCP